MMLQAMWMVESVYGYLKSTFAKAALFRIVTRILLVKMRHNDKESWTEKDSAWILLDHPHQQPKQLDTARRFFMWFDGIHRSSLQIFAIPCHGLNNPKADQTPPEFYLALNWVVEQQSEMEPQKITTEHLEVLGVFRDLAGTSLMLA